MLTVKEKYPDGRDSVKDMLSWVENMAKTVDDGRDIFRMLIPIISQTLKYEFSDANPNSWDALKSNYMKWKTKKGYPTTVGIMTGALKRSLTTDAKTKVRKHKLEYKMNPSITGYKGRMVGQYAQYFNKARKIFIFTKTFINDNIKKQVINVWLRKFKSGK